jgi:hypothetical protein
MKTKGHHCHKDAGLDVLRYTDRVTLALGKTPIPWSGTFRKRHRPVSLLLPRLLGRSNSRGGHAHDLAGLRD